MSRSPSPSSSLETVYHPGAVFQLYKGQPPPLPTKQPLLDLDGVDFERTKGRLYNCHLHNISIPSSSSPALSVTLLSPLSVGIRERITQVWRVSSGSYPNGLPSEPTLIARFYDPLYFKDPDGLVDPFIAIDSATATEAEAYRCLQPVQGDLVPNFRGLFLCSIPNQSRNVYVVVLDYIHGVDLASLDTLALCTNHKNVVVDQVLEVEHRLRSLGVVQNDAAPRNYILRLSNAPEAQGPGPEYCAIPTCPLRSTVDIRTLGIAVIDLEDVDFEDPEPPWSPEEREKRLEKERPYVQKWLDK